MRLRSGWERSTNKQVRDGVANFVKFLEVVSLVTNDAFDWLSEAYTTAFGESLPLAGYMFEDPTTKEDKVISLYNKEKAREVIAYLLLRGVRR